VIGQSSSKTYCYSAQVRESVIAWRINPVSKPRTSSLVYIVRLDPLRVTIVLQLFAQLSASSGRRELHKVSQFYILCSCHS
jgi:hypothetical protein